MDRDGNGAISLSEYFAIFEDHGITVSKEKFIETLLSSPNKRLEIVKKLII